MAARSRRYCRCWSLGPFALGQAFPAALGGRDATDDDGPAAPAATLATLSASPRGGLRRVRRCSPSHGSVNGRGPAVPLAPGEPGRKARGVDTGASRRPPTHRRGRWRSRPVLRGPPAALPPPLRHTIGRGRRACPRIAPRGVVPYLRPGDAGGPLPGAPSWTAAPCASWWGDAPARPPVSPARVSPARRR
jgi:hypothetical protein